MAEAQRIEQERIQNEQIQLEAQRMEQERIQKEQQQQQLQNSRMLCVDGTYAPNGSDTSARGRANACYGHGGFVINQR